LTCTEVTTLLKDIILSSAAITGAIVAVKGLGTWQRQLKGKSEYELSRRILVTLFKYRDAINGVRNPRVWADEMPIPSQDKAKTMSDEEIHFYGKSKAYEARWDNVRREKTALYADLLEAEAIWGDGLRDLFKNVFDLEHELLTRIRHYIELINPDTKEESKKAIREFDAKKRDIIFDSLGEDPDDFKSDLISAINDVKKYLKPKLRQERF